MACMHGISWLDFFRHMSIKSTLSENNKSILIEHMNAMKNISVKNRPKWTKRLDRRAKAADNTVYNLGETFYPF